jgi:hypothetical protein
LPVAAPWQPALHLISTVQDWEPERYLTSAETVAEGVRWSAKLVAGQVSTNKAMHARKATGLLQLTSPP